MENNGGNVSFIWTWRYRENFQLSEFNCKYSCEYWEKACGMKRVGS